MHVIRRHPAWKEYVHQNVSLERRILASRPNAALLDLGCGNGSDIARFQSYGARAVGVDASEERIRQARQLALAIVASGDALPWADASFEVVYISHLLHHVFHIAAVLAEAYRTLMPGGLLLLLETVENHPIIRLGRRINPTYDGDAVLSRFWYRELIQAVEAQGWIIRHQELFNIVIFGWEFLLRILPALRLFTPAIVGLELCLGSLARRYGAHCWIVAEKPGAALFPETLWREAP